MAGLDAGDIADEQLGPNLGRRQDLRLIYHSPGRARAEQALYRWLAYCADADIPGRADRPRAEPTTPRCAAQARWPSRSRPRDEHRDDEPGGGDLNHPSVQDRHADVPDVVLALGVGHARRAPLGRSPGGRRGVLHGLSIALHYRSVNLLC